MTEDPYSSYSFLLERTAKKVKQYAQKQFRQQGFNITVDQWSVLKRLYGNNNLKQNEIAELTFKDNPTLTRIIDLLCEKGLALREMNPGDRRSFLISLTPKGRSKVETISPQVAEIRHNAWKGLGENDFLQFQHVLNTIYNNLDEET